ncbi:MAG: Fe-Mn family superoxide dismutase [Candidatus Paceibacterota bacterium]
MEKFQEIKFNIEELRGISAKNIEEHLKLYAGYVKNTNLIFEKLGELSKESEKNAYVMGELHRRIGFEFNGMRNHEYYFKSLEGGARPLPENSEFKQEVEKVASSLESMIVAFKELAMTRGIGWAMLYWDKQSKQFIPTWVDEQHLGQLNGLSYVLGIDMWEHAYVYDYPTSEKKKYLDAFFENLNWEVIEENFKSAQ